MIHALLTAALLAAPGAPDADPAPAPSADPPAQEPVRVVATLPIYADIAEAIGGDAVRVTSIADPDEDAHFVRPKPSFALDLRRADMFITTGLDLELWVPTLLDKANNQQVLEGGRGYVTAYSGIELLDIPETTDRSEGDIHIYGNPHLHTDPLRTLQVARNVTQGLRSVAPDRSDRWNRGLQAYADRIYRALFGDRLVELLGGQALEKLAQSGNFFSFLESEEYEGTPLIEELGGWLAAAEPFRGADIICYHKNWAYFEERFRVTCAEYVEAKPGIPPTPGHVSELIDRMQSRQLNVVLAASYFDRSKVERVAQRGGATPIIVPLYPGTSGLEDYFAVVDNWVSSLASAVEGARTQ